MHHDTEDFRNDEINAETWKDIPGLLPGYMVSSLGRIWEPDRVTPARGIRREARLARPCVLKNGYLAVRAMTEASSVRTVYVHELVALAFHGPRPVRNHIRHLDGNQRNNRAENLAYGTAMENIHDTIRLGRHAHGETSGRSKLTDDQVRAIRDMRAIMRQAELAALFGVCKSTISMVSRKITWAHVA